MGLAIHIDDHPWNSILLAVQLFTFIVCITGIVYHCRHFSVPTLQTCYTRIFAFTMFFSLCCLLTYFYPFHEALLQNVTAVLESYVLYLFFHLTIQVAGGQQVVRRHYEQLAAVRATLTPFRCFRRLCCCCKPRPTYITAKLLHKQYLCALQVMVIRPICAILAEVILAHSENEHVEPTANEKNGALIVRTIGVLSMIAIMMAITSLYIVMTKPPVREVDADDEAYVEGDVATRPATTPKSAAAAVGEHDVESYQKSTAVSNSTSPSNSLSSKTGSGEPESAFNPILSNFRFGWKFLFIKLIVMLGATENVVVSFCLSADVIDADEGNGYTDVASGSRLIATLNVCQVFAMSFAVVWLFSHLDPALAEHSANAAVVAAATEAASNVNSNGVTGPDGVSVGGKAKDNTKAPLLSNAGEVSDSTALTFGDSDATVSTPSRLSAWSAFLECCRVWDIFYWRAT